MRYTKRLIIMLTGLLLISYSGPAHKADSKGITGSYAFSDRYRPVAAANAALRGYSKTNELKNAPAVYTQRIISPSSMNNLIIAAAVCSGIAPATAEQHGMQ